MNLSLNYKLELQAYCVSIVKKKCDLLKKQILARKQDLETASKSSAGDKHETARAMIHLEQEKLGFQYQFLNSLKCFLNVVYTNTQQSNPVH